MAFHPYGIDQGWKWKNEVPYGRPTLSVYPSFCFFPFPLSFIFSFLLPFTFFPCSWDILPKSSYLDSTGAGPGRSWPTNDFWCNGSANVQVLSLWGMRCDSYWPCDIRAWCFSENFEVAACFQQAKKCQYGWHTVSVTAQELIDY